MAKGTDIAKQEQSMSTRFMNSIVKEFAGSVGEVALTNFQKRLAQNYFIAVDQALVKAEQRRQMKKKNKDPLPITWANVDMQQLALDVVAAARVGLDPAQPNHVSVIPYKNNRTNKYDIGFIDGYRGIELKAMKYGLDVPDGVIVELVHANDTFKPIKKDVRNNVESYEFEITNAFDRGDIVGGFYYHSYSENPWKNKLVIFTKKDILKRKPEYAAPEFWGGEKTIWKDGKPSGTEKIEGWFEKMCWKTIYRAAYRDITIDSQKIDDDYLRLRRAEESYAELEMEQEMAGQANTEIIDIELDDEPGAPDDVPDEIPETTKTAQKPAEKTQKGVQKEQKAQQTIGDAGPGF